MNQFEKSAEQYELVLSGKCTEMNPRKGKGKVSLQVRLFSFINYKDSRTGGEGRREERG